ncbi:hypothetical protein BS78_10G133500 [Paspalum vaginatum]|nr:hypothetical protein BS78_10G133500 [Paspalum vaginatum]
MCLPFCGGGHSDHGSPAHHSGNQQPPPRPRPTHPSPPTEPTHRHVDRQPYKPIVRAARGDPIDASQAGVNKNGDADVNGYAAASVVRGPTMSIPAARAPQHKDAYDNLRHHGSVAASHPKEAAGKMRAPPVLQTMARRSGEDDYPAAATTTPTSFHGHR